MSSITDATSATPTPAVEEPTKVCSSSMTTSIILVVGALIIGGYTCYKVYSFKQKTVSEKQDLNKRIKDIADDLLENPTKNIKKNIAILKDLANEMRGKRK